MLALQIATWSLILSGCVFGFWLLTQKTEKMQKRMPRILRRMFRASEGSKEEKYLIRLIRFMGACLLLNSLVGLYALISIHHAFYQLKKTEPNQSLQTMITAVTSAASHPPRQLRSCLI